MCYAIPGRVVEVRGGLATVDYFGERKTARNEFDHLRPGDYIFAQGGYVIEILPAQAALDVLAAWEEAFVHLRATDARLSRPDGGADDRNPGLTRLLDRALAGRPLTDADLLYLLRLDEAGDLDLLYRAANFQRYKHHRNACCVHGILELSNICRRGCAYCGIQGGHAALPRYRMGVDEALAAAGEAIERHGFKALVLQSGEGAYTLAEQVELVEAIKARWPCLLFVSFGEVGLAGLERLYAAGARGLLLRFETANPDLFARLRPGVSFESRVAHVRRAEELGFLIATGGLVGLPGQTDEDLVRDLRLAVELRAEMYSFGPFLPAPGTPLADARPPGADRMLKILALARLLDPERGKVLITTALETLDPAARRAGLMAGGNTVMLNVTPMAYRGLYALYPNRAHTGERIETQVEETVGMLRELGRAPTDLSVSAG